MIGYMQQNFGKVETNGNKTWKFDAWVSDNSCTPSIRKKLRRRKKEIKRRR
jgi:hypothetical protein